MMVYCVGKDFLRPSMLPWVGQKMDLMFQVETNNLAEL